MDIEYICEFVILSETCNYMEAADQLFISQSALSRHIKTLEESLGVQLLDRSTRKVSLSRFGMLFLPYARQILATRYEYETAISTALKAAHGNIRIGAIPVMSHYHITDLILRFQKENPGISLDLIEGDTTDLTRMLRSGQCDIAFVREGEDSTDEFNIIHHDTDQLAAFLRKDHPFASRQFIRIEHLRTEPLMLLS
ncbi:MAG: LysR family transcriptional regulator, partial [Aristaeellaceae bacterium]